MSQRPYTIFGTKTGPVVHGATDFLRGNQSLARLLPAAQRLGRLQGELAGALPGMAGLASVLSFENGQLVIGVANGAVAAKLKQSLPKLQATLCQRGWAIEGIKLKIHMAGPPQREQYKGGLSLPPTAVQAFDELSQNLESSPQNAGLIEALRRLTARRK